MLDKCAPAMSQPHSPVLDSQPGAPLRGVEHPAVIDLIAHDAKTGEVALVMVETRPWDGSELRLFQLQEKINAYLSFALDGEMAEAYPAFVGKPIRLQLDCTTAPDVPAVNLLSLIREQIAFQGIDLQVRVAAAGGCGPACACES